MKKAVFLADLHLGATYDQANREVEKSAVRFLDSIKEDVSELYLLGDILDYWFEYRHVVPRGYVRFFGKLAELADAGVRITWFIGNHDIWIFDYLPSELGIEVVDGSLHRSILGSEFCLQHGDAIVGDPMFRFLRSLFRNRVCQRLYANIHPRWTVGFAYACSRRSRMKKSGLDDESFHLIDGMRKWCADAIKEGDPTKYFVFGHLHAAYDESLPDNRHLIVLPAWNVTKKFGVFDGNVFKICKFEG